ncbi:MAG: hypothetical protein HY403_03665 [Elusimicrobia bacterium]|nr:hypothetical protein [Elusimicrobiota bacterium]
MICALLVDPDDSIDFPGNEAEVLGRPLAAYPLLAAKGSEHARRLYAQTTSPPVRRIAVQLGAIILDPPAAGGAEHPPDATRVLLGYRQIVDDLKAEKAELELLVLLFANTGAVNTALIDSGVQALLDDAGLDSAATVSPYNRWNPRRAFREAADGRLVPYAECLPEAGTPWFPDWGAAVLRPRVLDALKADAPDLSWLGEKILPLKQVGGGPVDYSWQVPKMEYWLKKQGVRDSPRPEPKLKPAPAPKPDRR